MIWNRILYYCYTRSYMSCCRTAVELSIFVDLGNYCLRNNIWFFLSSLFCLNFPSSLIVLIIPRNCTGDVVAMCNIFYFVLIFILNLEVPVRIRKSCSYYYFRYLFLCPMGILHYFFVSCYVHFFVELSSGRILSLYFWYFFILWIWRCEMFWRAGIICQNCHIVFLIVLKFCFGYISSSWVFCCCFVTSIVWVS